MTVGGSLLDDHLTDQVVNFDILQTIGLNKDLPRSRVGIKQGLFLVGILAEACGPVYEHLIGRTRLDKSRTTRHRVMIAVLGISLIIDEIGASCPTDPYSIAIDLIILGHCGFFPLQHDMSLVDEEIEVLRNDALVDLDEIQLWIGLCCSIARLAVASLIVGSDGIFIALVGLRGQVVGVVSRAYNP